MKTPIPISIRIKTSDHPKWPKWFSIKNYDCLADLTAKQFLNELEFRLTLYNSPTLPNGRKLTDSKRWQLIQKGYVIINSNPITSSEFPTVITLNHIDLLTITETIKLRTGEDYLNLEPQVMMPLLGQAQELAVIGVDLNQSNETILADLGYLLIQLRENLKNQALRAEANHQAIEKGLRIHELEHPAVQQIEETSLTPKKRPKKANHTDVKTFKKLLTYKLIPYLDLMMYCYNHVPFYEDNWQKLEFTQNVLSELLLGEESKQDPRIELYKKTYAPFYRKILSNESHLMQLLASIRQNTWVLGTKMQDI